MENPGRERKYSRTTTYEFSNQEAGVTIPEDKADLETWPLLLSNWEKYTLSSNYREVLHDRVRKGIPSSIRGEAWKIMSGGNELKKKNPGVYEILVTKESSSEDCLKKDVDRTFPLNKTFRLKVGQGQTAMYNVLKVYSIMDPEVGYCQGMSFLCGSLIEQNMSEVDVFWSFSAMMRGLNLRGFFLDSLPLLKLFVYRFTQLFQFLIPALFGHFKQYGVDTLFFCVEWFNTLFSFNIPLETTSRIWDVLFLEGPDYLLCVALAILKQSEELLMKSDSFDKIMAVLKKNSSCLDVSIIKVSEQYEKIFSLLPGIDKKYERDKSKDLI